MSAEKKNKDKICAGANSAGGEIVSSAQLIEWDYLPGSDNQVYTERDRIESSAGTVYIPTDADGKVIIPPQETEFPRPLNDYELDILTPIFKRELDYSKIRIYLDNWGTIGGYSRGIGYRICIYHDAIKSDGTIIEEILIHEAAHVWQFQNAMHWTYAPKSIIQQIIAGIHGDVNKAYNYDELVNKKVPWDQWGPEQQAAWIAKNKMLPTPEMLRSRKK